MLKKHVILIGLSLLSLIYLAILFRQNPLKGNIIMNLKNYIVFYHEVTPSNISNIARYDMAILEPLNVTSKQLLKLKKSNTIAYGYQSIFEVELYNEKKIELLNEADYLYIDGVRPFNERYQCYYGDIRSPHYREVLLDSIEENVIAKGFNGVFFDTLDDIEFFIESPVKEELFQGYIDFFNLLKSEYPDLSIIQNRAFKLYTLGTAEYVDGLMFEDLAHEVLESKDTFGFYNNLMQDLSKTAKKNNVAMLGMSYKNPEENYKLAQKLNWLYYFHPEDNPSLEIEDPIYNITIH